MGEELVYVCEICQTVLEEHHCKAICPNCGRTFDCSDLPVIPANAKVDDEHRMILSSGGDPLDLVRPAGPSGNRGQTGRPVCPLFPEEREAAVKESSEVENLP